VGVAKRRWVILEDDDGVVALDAARAAMALSLREGGSARRLVPARVLLAPADVETLTDADATLHASGLDLARFGPREFAVKAVPPALVDADPAEVLRVAADALRAGQSLVVAWSQRLPPPPLEEALDDVGVRTLLATIEEVGLAIESVRLPLRM
jgi:DNA mismatch repair ATPase MutL